MAIAKKIWLHYCCKLSFAGGKNGILLTNMAAFPFSSKMFNGPLSAWIVSIPSAVDPLDEEEPGDSVNPFEFSEPKK